VIQASLGEFHGLVLLASGAAMAWGMEQGNETYIRQSVHIGSRLGSLPEYATLNQPEPRLLHLPLKVIDVEAGAFHSALLTVDGRLWTWGSNSKGQLGHGLGVNDVPRPRPVEAFCSVPAVRIQRVSLGGFHSAAIDETGHLYTWGDNVRGQCGQGDLKLLSKPELLQITCSDITCTRVSCGGFFTIIGATEDPCGKNDYNQRSRFFVCGWGKEGCLGFGQPCKRMLRPQPMARAPNGYSWTHLYAGMVHVAGLLAPAQHV